MKIIRACLNLGKHDISIEFQNLKIQWLIRAICIKKFSTILKQDVSIFLFLLTIIRFR